MICMDLENIMQSTKEPTNCVICTLERLIEYLHVRDLF